MSSLHKIGSDEWENEAQKDAVRDVHLECQNINLE